MNGRVRSLLHVLAAVGLLLSAAPARKLALPRTPEPAKSITASAERKNPVDKKKRPPLTVAQALPQIAIPRSVQTIATLASAKAAGVAENRWNGAAADGGDLSVCLPPEQHAPGHCPAIPAVSAGYDRRDPVAFVAGTCIRPNAPPVA